MGEKNYTHSIQLVGGIETTDKDSKSKIVTIHKKVTFGRRLTVKDLMLIEDNPQAKLRTQHEDLIRQRMITAFGSLKMPVTLPQLLSLDRIDRQDIGEGADEFIRNSRGGNNAEYLENNKVKLYFGFKIADVVYDIVQFGNRLTGNDEVECDRLGFEGIRRLAFEIGKQISHLESSEHTMLLDGTVLLENFESLDSEDFGLLRVGGEMFTQSFRLGRKKVSEERDGDAGVSTGKGVGLGGKRDSKSAEGAN